MLLSLLVFAIGHSGIRDGFELFLVGGKEKERTSALAQSNSKQIK
jgi:hypothetical protein